MKINTSNNLFTVPLLWRSNLAYENRGFKRHNYWPSSLILCITLGLCLVFVSDIQAGSRKNSCGGNGQRPCKAAPTWAGGDGIFPSCDPGLAENFAKGTCGRDVIKEKVVDPVIDTTKKAAEATVKLVNGVGQTVGACTKGSVDKCSTDIRKAYYSGVNTMTTITTPVLRDAEKVTKKGWEETRKLAEGLFDYVKKTELATEQVRKPLNSIGTAWKEAASEQVAEQQALTRAIIRGDGPAIEASLEKLVLRMVQNAGFGEAYRHLKGMNAGSLMLFVAADAGVGVTYEGTVGFAINMNWLGRQFIRQQTSGLIDLPADPSDKVIGSLFMAHGLQAGPAASAGIDFNTGYHLAKPDGVNGPSLDVSIEVKAAVGGGFGGGWDLTKAPPQLVTAAVGVGAGAGLKAAVGPSYAFILGQLCANGSFQELVRACPDIPGGTIRGTGTGTSTPPSSGTGTGTGTSAKLDTALDCVSKYAKANTCDWDHWSEMFGACKTGTVPELNDNDFLLNKVKGGQCTWNNWTNLYKEAKGIGTRTTTGGNRYVAAKGNSNKCMVKKEMNNNNGNIIHLWDCAGGVQENKRWTYEPATGYIRLVAQPLKCLAKQGWPNEWENGRIAHLWDCNHPAQANLKWNYDSSTGYIRAQTNSNKCLQKQSGDWNNGNRIHVWDCNVGPAGNKEWSLMGNL